MSSDSGPTLLVCERRVTVNFTRHFVDSMHGAPGTAHHCYVDGARPSEGNLAPGDFVAQIPRFPVTGGLAAGADWLDPETNCERGGDNGALDGMTARFEAGPEHVYVTHMASPQWNDGGWSKTWINTSASNGSSISRDLTLSSGVYEHHIAHSEEQRVGGRFGTLTPDRLHYDRFHAWLSQSNNHKLILTGPMVAVHGSQSAGRGRCRSIRGSGAIGTVTRIGTGGWLKSAKQRYRNSIAIPASSGAAAAAGLA